MAYNKKMFGLGSKRSIIREIFEYSKCRSAEIGAENVYDFSLGNPSVPAPREVNDALRELLDNMDPVRLHGYTSAQGDASVRAAIAHTEPQSAIFPKRRGSICAPEEFRSRRLRFCR